MYDCPNKLLDDHLEIYFLLKKSIEKSGNTLLGKVFHKFDPQGVTGLFLLAESHLSIHTWPEFGYAAVDIFSCGENSDPDKACNYIIESFSPRKYLLKRFSRGNKRDLRIENRREESLDFLEGLSV
jgi:S-adenosylmethionine decarboxylase